MSHTLLLSLVELQMDCNVSVGVWQGLMHVTTMLSPQRVCCCMLMLIISPCFIVILQGKVDHIRKTVLVPV